MTYNSIIAEDYITADEQEPLPDRDLPDRDLPDRDLPDRDLPDRELPDRELSDRELSGEASYIRYLYNRAKNNKAMNHWLMRNQTTISRPAYKRMSGVIRLGLFLAIILLASFFVATNLAAEDFTPKNEAGLKYALVTVQEGDSLWQLVSQAGLNINTSYLIEQTLKYNNLKGTYLTVGQKIYIPCAE